MSGMEQNAAISMPVEASSPDEALAITASTITAINPKPQEIEVKT